MVASVTTGPAISHVDPGDLDRCWAEVIAARRGNPDASSGAAEKEGISAASTYADEEAASDAAYLASLRPTDTALQQELVSVMT